MLANQLKDVFTELKSQEDYVSKVIFEEETSFLRTLEKRPEAHRIDPGGFERQNHLR